MRAMLEAICFQTRDVLEAMQADSGTERLPVMFVDGGASQNDLLMQVGVGSWRAMPLLPGMPLSIRACPRSVGRLVAILNSQSSYPSGRGLPTLVLPAGAGRHPAGAGAAAGPHGDHLAGGGAGGGHRGGPVDGGAGVHRHEAQHGCAGLGGGGASALQGSQAALQRAGERHYTCRHGMRAQLSSLPVLLALCISGHSEVGARQGEPPPAPLYVGICVNMLAGPWPLQAARSSSHASRQKQPPGGMPSGSLLCSARLRWRS